MKKLKQIELPNYEENFMHHSRLFWEVTILFTTAIGGLLTFIIVHNEINQISKGVLNSFGLFLTFILVYFACSFRVLKQEAFALMLNSGKHEPNKKHLNQWWPYVITWWILGLIFIWNFYFSNFRSLELIWNVLSLIGILLALIWTAYVSIMSCKYFKTDSLKDALNNIQKSKIKNK